jgi:hypothetical protein
MIGLGLKDCQDRRVPVPRRRRLRLTPKISVTPAHNSPPALRWLLCGPLTERPTASPLILSLPCRWGHPSS